MDLIVKSIPLSQIVPSQHQARKAFDEERLKGLAESMRHQGLVQPVTVRPMGEGRGEKGETAETDVSPLALRPSPLYELISGERRLRAAKLLSWTEIEAKIIQTANEAEAAAKGLVENMQREDLNPIEEAEAFQELSQLDSKNWNQVKIGAIVGRERDYVSRSLSLLGLPEPVLSMLRRRNIDRGHGIELLRINNANSQKGMANKIAKGQWSVKQTRAAIDRLSAQTKPPKDELPKPADPLAEVWAPLIEQGVKEGKPWGVMYGSVPKPGEKSVSLPAWLIWVAYTGGSPRAEMKRWLLQLAEAMGDTRDEERIKEVGKGWEATSEAEKEQLPDALTNARLPKNAQEQTELEALAAKGPGPVYAWVYGEGSFYAKKAAASTWQEMGGVTPVEGTRRLVEGLKMFQLSKSGQLNRDLSEATKG